MSTQGKIGLILGSAIAPEDIAGAAAQAEQNGFDEIWLAEDYFFTGGISGASVVLFSAGVFLVALGYTSLLNRINSSRWRSGASNLGGEVESLH